MLITSIEERVSYCLSQTQYQKTKLIDSRVHLIRISRLDKALEQLVGQDHRPHSVFPSMVFGVLGLLLGLALGGPTHPLVSFQTQSPLQLLLPKGCHVFDHDGHCSNGTGDYSLSAKLWTNRAVRALGTKYGHRQRLWLNVGKGHQVLWPQHGEESSPHVVASGQKPPSRRCSAHLGRTLQQVCWGLCGSSLLCRDLA